MKYLKKFEGLNLNSITDQYLDEYEKIYPEIAGVGSNSEQSIDGEIVQPATLAVYLYHRDNIDKMPSKYMGVDVIYYDEK